MIATMSEGAAQGPVDSRLTLAAALFGVITVGAVAAWLGWREPEARWPVAGAAAAAAQADSPAGSSPQLGASAAGSRRSSKPTPPVRIPKARDRSPAAQAAAALASPGPGAAESWPLWEFQLKQPIAPRDPPLTPPNWRLVGASNDGKAWQLIVMRQGDPQPVFFKVGQSLPGGYLIEAITEEEVTLKQRQRRLVLSYIGY